MAVSRSLRDPPREGLGTVRLHVLGSPSVQRDDQPCGGAAAQRKSLALLALLAVAGRRGLSRDKILALLWPEIPGDKATHRLAQLLYSLRRDLQAEELFLGSPEVHLNSTLLTSDLSEFTDALESGDFALVDWSRPARWATASERSVSLMFPRALLALPHRHA